MKIYQVQAPDGSIIKVEGPEGASQDEVIAQAQRLMAQRSAPQQAPTGEAALPSPAAEVPPIDYNQVARDTANDMTGMEKFLAGMGGAVAGLDLGGRQVIANMIGNDKWKRDLQDEAEEYKRLTGALGETGAGSVGNVAGNIAMMALPGGLLGRAAGASLPLAITAEGALGAGAGALQPTTEEGERAKNAAIGGALGAAGPLAGKAIGAGGRWLLGGGDDAATRAAGILSRYGIEVPKADVAPGVVSKVSQGILENLPGTGAMMAGAREGREDAVRTALFKMLGKEVPETGEALAAITDDIGAQIGAASTGKRVPLANVAPGIRQVLQDYKVLPAQANRHITKQADNILELASIPGAQLKGEWYQGIRSQMQADARTATGQHKRALAGMVKVLDDEFGKALQPDEAAKLTGDRAKYRLALLLEKAGLKEGKLDLTKARNAVERESRRGQVMPEAKSLLEAASVAMPKSRPGGRLGTSLLGAGVTATNPILAAGAAGGAGLTRAILNTGLPQKAANSAVTRRRTADALRGLTQSYVQDEED